MITGSSLVTLALFVVGVIVIIKSIRVVPQQHALVVERWGRFHAVLEPGLNFVVPFVDRVAYRHDLREIPLDVPSQICITKDNTQLQVDGILYFQVTDPRLASYGSSTPALEQKCIPQVPRPPFLARKALGPRGPACKRARRVLGRTRTHTVRDLTRTGKEHRFPAFRRPSLAMGPVSRSRRPTSPAAGT